jgi:hypothetical protein
MNGYGVINAVEQYCTITGISHRGFQFYLCWPWLLRKILFPAPFIFILTAPAAAIPGPAVTESFLDMARTRKSFQKDLQKTTNNRMELMAVIKGLEALKHPHSKVVIVSDSKYVVEAINQGWLLNWEKKDWKKVKNADLWKQFLVVFRKTRRNI